MPPVLTGTGGIYLSLGNAFFHPSLPYPGQRVDRNGPYGITLALVSMALYHVFYKIRFTRLGKQVWLVALVGTSLAFLKGVGAGGHSESGIDDRYRIARSCPLA